MPLRPGSSRKVPAADNSGALPPAVRELPVEVRGGIAGAPSLDTVAEELPVALVYNGISHAVMMTSPGDLADFALGFSVTEGILDRPGQLYDLEVVTSELGVSVEMRIASDCLARLQERRRNLAGRTGCGLCGVDSLAQAVLPVQPVESAPLPEDSAVQGALTQLVEHQQLQGQTGATHAAAWCDVSGRVLCVREDVGRHNALDKVIGARLAACGDDAFAGGFALVSSRASYEMVQKCGSVGIGCLVALSAPTALAIRLARQAGMTLIAFARPGRHVIYHQGTAKMLEESHD